MRRPPVRLAIPAVMLLAASCTDAGTVPLSSPTPAAPRLGTLGSQVGCSAKTQASETVPAGSNATQISAAVQRSRVVYLPQGTYTLNAPIRLPSCTHVYGDGDLTVLVQQKSTDNVDGDWQAGSSVFNVVETGGVFSENVLVENLKATASYTSTDASRPWLGSTARAAVYVDGGSDVTVSNITTQNLSLLASGLVSASSTRLNSRLRVHNSRASGYAGGWHAVALHWVDSVTVAGNTLSGFRGAVLAWGGDADPTHTWMHNHYVDRNTPLLAKRILIENNNASQVGWKLKRPDGTWEYDGSGIMVSMAEGAMIRGNDVYYCADICLDAEGSKDVEFHDNDAGYAPVMAMGFFFDSRNVKFTWNRLVQDDYYGGALFGNLGSHFSYCDSRGCGRYSDDIQANNNTFTWQGTGTGRVYKNHSSTYKFINNTLVKTVVRFTEQTQFNGYMEVTGNTVDLMDRVASVPAMDVGYNAENSIWVNGNYVTSQVSQTQPGIQVRQGWANPVAVWIHSNRVNNFPSSIIFRADNNVCHTFDIQSNRVTGSILNQTPSGYCNWVYMPAGSNQQGLPIGTV